MSAEIERLLAEVFDVRSDDHICDITTKLSHALGVEYFVYTQYKSRTIVSEDPRSDVTLTNLPSVWVEKYNTSALIVDDPTVIPLLHGEEHNIWCRESIARLDTTPGKSFLRMAVKLDLKYGAVISLKSNNGSFAFMSWIAKGQAGLSTDDLESNLPKLRFVSEVLHAQISRTLVPNKLLNRNGVPNNVLSPREREVIQWVAQGKTAWEISVILSISKKSVELYSTNAMKKLGATNRTQAVAHALSLGTIAVPGYIRW